LIGTVNSRSGSILVPFYLDCRPCELLFSLFTGGMRKGIWLCCSFVA